MLPKTYVVRTLLLAAITLTAISGGLATPTTRAATGDGSVTDANITYVGRWEVPAATAVPNWTGAYLSTKFTGTTVKVKTRNSVNFYASIDGGADVFYAGVSGVVNLTSAPLPSG